MDVGWSGLLLVLGLAFSALCSGAETALTALPLSRVEALSRQDHKLARWAWRRWRQLPHRVLVTLLVLNNAANVGISALATELALRLLGSQGLAVAVGAATLGLLVFGEVTPKSLARVDPESVARHLILLVVVADSLLVPLTVPLLGLSHLLAKLRGTPLHEVPKAATLEDLRFLLSLSRQEGHLSALQAEMLEAVLGLEQKLVRDVQVPRPDVVLLSDAASFHEVVDKVLQSGFSRYPVYHGSDDNIVGVLHAADLLRCHREGKSWTTYLKPALCVPETSRLVTLLAEMRAKRVHLAASFDEYGSLAGIVTLANVLEAIVGEIADEFRQSSPAVQALMPGVWLVKASLPLERLARLTGQPLTSPAKVYSVGGLLMSQLGGLPQPGQKLYYQGYLFTVEEATRQRVLKVRVAYPAPPPA